MLRIKSHFYQIKLMGITSEKGFTSIEVEQPCINPQTLQPYIQKEQMKIDKIAALKVLLSGAYAMATADVFTMSQFLKIITGFGGAIKITSKDLDQAMLINFVQEVIGDMNTARYALKDIKSKSQGLKIAKQWIFKANTRLSGPGMRKLFERMQGVKKEVQFMGYVFFFFKGMKIFVEKQSDELYKAIKSNLQWLGELIIQKRKKLFVVWDPPRRHSTGPKYYDRFYQNCEYSPGKGYQNKVIEAYKDLFREE